MLNLPALSNYGAPKPQRVTMAFPAATLMRIVLYYYGKVRDRNASAICEEYVKRCQRYGRVELVELKPRQETWDQPGATVVMLSPDGDLLDTPDFAAIVGAARLAARDLHFVIGPTDGHPDAWKQRAGRLISLSRLTFPHELARAMVCEQIYRALTLIAGHPYPR
ncbi:MAG: 23S rRNA (pseudouridine(1915)-N(3))-methyltransferase RlmH [Bryobacterales bacterium]|nr:23S rRNA (pseudouridine(1915)-N(3))-methyltransferase RlmH [Bryobacterales bacterium]